MDDSMCDKKQIVRESAEAIVVVRPKDDEGPNVYIVRITKRNVRTVRK